MSLPATTPTLPVPVTRPLPVPRGLPPVPSRRSLGPLVRRALPALRASLVVVAAGIVVEHALRALTRRTATTLATPGDVMPMVTPVVMHTRVVVTEFVIRERTHRLR